jgi:hypothetical protein
LVEWVDWVFIGVLASRGVDGRFDQHFRGAGNRLNTTTGLARNKNGPAILKDTDSNCNDTSMLKTVVESSLGLVSLVEGPEFNDARTQAIDLDVISGSKSCTFQPASHHSDLGFESGPNVSGCLDLEPTHGGWLFP